MYGVKRARCVVFAEQLYAPQHSGVSPFDGGLRTVSHCSAGTAVSNLRALHRLPLKHDISQKYPAEDAEDEITVQQHKYEHRKVSHSNL
jgi:hypothetical protein